MDSWASSDLHAYLNARWIAYVSYVITAGSSQPSLRYSSSDIVSGQLYRPELCCVFQIDLSKKLRLLGGIVVYDFRDLKMPSLPHLHFGLSLVGL